MSTFWYGGFAHHARARCVLTRADYADASADADRAIELSARRNDLLALCSAYLVRAEAAHGLNDRTAAHRYVGLVSELLDPLDARGIVPERLRVIGRQLRTTPRRRLPQVAEHSIEALSDRETALLRLLPGKLNQRELGDVLHVSLNTIKTHNRSIYRKLGVSSRDDAVAVARAAGLL